MSELDPRAKDLIGLAREGEGPTQAELSRLRGAVLSVLRVQGRGPLGGVGNRLGDDDRCGGQCGAELA